MQVPEALARHGGMHTCRRAHHNTHALQRAHVMCLAEHASDGGLGAAGALPEPRAGGVQE